MRSIQPEFTEYHNSPIIIRDKFQVSGSDAAQIGWVEVATEDGTSGYLWYLKAESETRLRFEDYMEMAMVEGEKSSCWCCSWCVTLQCLECLFKRYSRFICCY